MTNIHLRTLMRPAQLVWATPGMMMILDADVEEEDNFYLNCLVFGKKNSKGPFAKWCVDNFFWRINYLL